MFDRNFIAPLMVKCLQSYLPLFCFLDSSSVSLCTCLCVERERGLALVTCLLILHLR